MTNYQVRMIGLTTIRLQSVLREKNSKEVSPPLSNGLMLSFFLEYFTALSRFRWWISASTEFNMALVLVPWRISVFLPVSTWHKYQSKSQMWASVTERHIHIICSFLTWKVPKEQSLLIHISTKIKDCTWFSAWDIVCCTLCQKKSSLQYTKQTNLGDLLENLSFPSAPKSQRS